MIYSVELGFAGDEVTAIRFDHEITLMTLRGFEVRLQAQIDLEGADGHRARIDPEVVEPEASQVLAALHQAVIDCVADQSGHLTIGFADLVIRVSPDELYEAWTVSGPAGYRVVCTPGGELAVWSASQ
jgi:hypothetical protein